LKWWQAVLLGGILLAAAALRFTGLDWDDYHHYHPDERYITWIATTIEWPPAGTPFWDPAGSTFNPFYWPENASSAGIEVLQGEPRSYAYGHLPLYLGVAVTRLAEWAAPGLSRFFPADAFFTQDILNAAGQIEFRHLTVVARALTALVDVLTVFLVFWVGRQLFGPGAGLLAAAFLAFNVMHIQLAHFFIVDPFLTFFTVAAVGSMVAAARPGRGRSAQIWLVVAAIGIGLAMGSKFSAALLVLPLAIALWVGPAVSRRRFLGSLLGLGVLAGLTFVLTNPFAVLDWNCAAVLPARTLGSLRIPEINFGSCYLENIVRQGLMVQGDLDAPFTRQYNGTLPYLYFVEMQMRWGMGLPLGIAAFVGFGWAVWRGLRAVGRRAQEWQRGEREKRWADYLPAGEWILLAWTVPYFLTTGSFFAKFMRYMQPLTPFLMIYAAGMLLRWKQPWLRRVAVASTLAFTALYALAFVSMYEQEHPWTAASAWIFENIPPEAVIVSELWDQTLPTSGEVDGEFRSRLDYDLQEFTWLERAAEGRQREQLTTQLQQLADADLVVIASNRVYGVVPGLPEQYPLSSQYHQLLFDGDLGYELAFVASRSARLGDVHLWADRFNGSGVAPPAGVAAYLDTFSRLDFGRADESFLVYDQPLVMLFRNTGQLTMEEMLARFDLTR
jgi:hypothetical protein